MQPLKFSGPIMAGCRLSIQAVTPGPLTAATFGYYYATAFIPLACPGHYGGHRVASQFYFKSAFHRQVCR